MVVFLLRELVPQGELLDLHLWVLWLQKWLSCHRKCLDDVETEDRRGHALMLKCVAANDLVAKLARFSCVGTYRHCSGFKYLLIGDIHTEALTVVGDITEHNFAV